MARRVTEFADANSVGMRGILAVSSQTPLRRIDTPHPDFLLNAENLSLSLKGRGRTGAGAASRGRLVVVDVRRTFADDLTILAGDGDVDAGDDVFGFDGVFHVMFLDLHGADFGG